jgi:HAD superfamily hydrolase (TIGR01509 family)
MSIEAVLFDLDGTLVDTERESGEAMAEALREGLGLEIDQQALDYVIGKSWVDIREYLARRYQAMTWTFEQLIEQTARLREKIFEDRGIEPLPGVLEVLERFAHLPKAVVTGSSRAEARHALEGIGVIDQFVAVFASEDIATSKPMPEGYLEGAKACGVDPRTCLVIEDSEHGIAAGLAAGAHVIAVRAGNFAGHDQSRAHRIVDTIDHITWPFLADLVGKTDG